MVEQGGRVERIGLISDTHGRVDGRLFTNWAGEHQVSLILHGGDVGSDDVLLELGAIAPVLAVKGNTDYWAGHTLPLWRKLNLGGREIVLLHQLEHLYRVPVELTRDTVVIYGHTHRPFVGRQAADGPILINPGSAGPRRFSLPWSAGIMELVVPCKENERPPEALESLRVRIFSLESPVINESSLMMEWPGGS